MIRLRSDNGAEVRSLRSAFLRLGSLELRLLGMRPPPEGASRAERLSWIRALSLRLLPFAVAIWVVFLVLWGFPTWALVVFGVVAALQLEGLVSLTLKIRRERQRGESPPA